jgi:hypothetical protein
MLPRLGRLFLGKRDVRGEWISGVLVREMAYDIAVDMLARLYKSDDRPRLMPDVVTLAGGIKEPSKRQNSDESSTAESVERVPWPQES